MKTGLLSPSSMLFLLLIPLFISINITISLGAADADDDVRFTSFRSSSCSSGLISNLKYPFWGVNNRADSCGLPDFELYCEANTSRIIVQAPAYRTLQLNLTSKSLTLVRDGYYDTICPSFYRNNTFDPTTFEYVDGVSNVTFLYHCPSHASYPSYLTQNCTRDGNMYTVHYVHGTAYDSNCMSVIMPVLYDASSTIQDVLHLGFGLEWKVNMHVW